MRLAAIDIGTNSVHMIVVQVRPDFSFEVIDREKEMVRLGAGGLDGKKLTTEAMTSALQALLWRQPPALPAKPKTAVISWRRSSERRGFGRASSPVPTKRD